MASLQVPLGNINHYLYKYLENNNIAEAKHIINDYFSSVVLKDKNYRGFISLVLKYYILTNDDCNLDLVFESHKKNLMKRDVLSYIQYNYKKNYDKAYSSFRYLKDTYFLDSNNIDILVENKMFDFIKMLTGSYMKASDSKIYNYISDYSVLSRVNFDVNIIKQTLDLISKKINVNILNNFLRNINKTEDKIIIDAGNILFSTSGKITINGYNHLIKLINIIQSLKLVPIVVIHNRHLKPRHNGTLKECNILNAISIIKNIPNIYILETPYNQNDDFYIIYLGLMFQSKIITKDNFKDHIYSFKTNKDDSDENMIFNYIEELLVKYQLVGDNIILDNIRNFSNCIQSVDNKLYIPTKSNRFIYFNHI